jgi:hypothetical protein
MTYATIEQAYGSLDGQHMLNTPLKGPMGRHPLHQQRMDQIQRKQTEPHNGGAYQCYYNNQPCEQIVANNNQFNQAQKHTAEGLQYPGPQTLLPQYPWYPYSKQQYLMYGPGMSQAWYSNPWLYYPHIAQQVFDYQQQHPNNYSTPIGNYHPVGFTPNSGQQFFPQRQPTATPTPGTTIKNWFNKRKENFGDKDDNLTISLCFFIFFLITVLVILSLCLIALSQKTTR